MNNNTCGLCGSIIPSGSEHTIVLSAEERSSLPNSPSSLTYCEPCHKVMSDPQSAASLISSMLEVRLRGLGVSPTLRSVETLKAKLVNLALRGRKGRA